MSLSPACWAMKKGRSLQGTKQGLTEKASSHQDRTFQHGSAEFSAEEAGKGGGATFYV